MHKYVAVTYEDIKSKIFSITAIRFGSMPKVYKIGSQPGLLSATWVAVRPRAFLDIVEQIHTNLDLDKNGPL